jgi:serine/threonine-protein kinase
MADSLQDLLQRALGAAYRIEREIGAGGMATVFAAVETSLGRRVAIKVLQPELVAELSTDRFAREVRLAASLQQANIVPLLSAGVAAGFSYYTMPLVDGSSLRARVASGVAVPMAEAVSILKDVARALAYAHTAGIVHRDIKPDNILLSGGTAVVSDFGIAKAMDAARPGTTPP